MVKDLILVESKILNGSIFPLAFQPTNESESVHITQWLRENQSELDDLLRKYKAILFRGFNLKNAEDFDSFVEATNYQGMAYLGGAAVRTQLTSRVFTANESPSTEKIPFHHEMAQTPSPPTHLFFFCEVAATTGGETPILPSTEIYKQMYIKYPEFMEKLENVGVKYIRVMPEEDDPTSAIGRGWKSTFLTDSKEGAEAGLVSLGSTWEWLPDGSLKTITAVLPAVRIDSGPNRSNEKTFFNSVVAAFSGWNDSRNIGERAVVFGDDSLCDRDVMYDILHCMDEMSVAFKWQSGDVLVLDNRTAMHSRRPFTGARRVLASLVRDPSR